MDRETLFQYFEQNYISKRDVLPSLPLGMNPDIVWEELQKRRKARCTVLPIHGPRGESCWYVTTDRMIAASERVVEEFMTYQPSLEPTALAPPEENYYTSLLEGMEMGPEEAMQFLLSEEQPNGPEEQRIHNNRYGLAFAEMNLYHPLDERFIQTLAEIVTTNMEQGGGQYRATDNIRVESMGDEDYSVPPARMISDCVRELTAFLADPSTHPMIKAGVVQAWVLMVRPFAEGNERLARLLSLVLLHRAGYSFFGEVSFSSLIATNGYAYYEAVNSLLRRENGGDLTYFLDYFLQLLAHATNERGRIAYKKNEETLAAERQMAGTVLAPADSEPVFDDEEIPEMDISEFTFLSSGDPYTDEEMRTPEEGDDLQQEGGEWAGESRIRERLSAETTARSKEYKELLFQYLKSGKFVFTSREVTEALQKSSGTVSAFMKKLCDVKILRIVQWIPGRPMIYSFDPGDKELTEENYSKEYLDMLSTLSSTARSNRDSRIGKVLHQCIPYGYITKQMYSKISDEEKWKPDMEFAEQIGLVKRVDENCYFILREIRKRFDQLNDAQKKKATEMYNTFGGELFSQEMVVATLSYSESAAKAVLHQFRLLRILDCHRDGINLYQFLVNPKENPECFEPAA